MGSSTTVVLVLLMAATSAFATDYTVGDSQGWTTGLDYSTWLSGKTFKAGDALVFQYGSTHTVDEVSQTDYTSCSAASPIKTYNDQNTKITLAAGDKRYFICGISNHCSQGMKLAVTVSGTSSGGSPPTPTSPSPASPATPSSPPPPPPPPSPSAAPIRAGISEGVAVVLGVSLGLALLG